MNVCLRFLMAVLFVCFHAAACLAAIRPSFHLERSAWLASDIILVNDDGKQRPFVTVVESWKGELRPGDKVSLSGLPPADAPKPVLKSNDTAFPDAAAGRVIVFFLLRQSVDKVTARTVGSWKGVSWSEKDLWASAAFVDSDTVKVHWQTMNPGPSTLQPSSLNRAQLQSEVQAVLKAQQELRSVSGIASNEDRAKALLPIAKNSYDCAQRDALRLLGECGAPALPLLRSLVISNSKHCEGDRYGNPSFEAQVAEALAAAAGPEKSQELTAVVVEELAYWKKTAPALTVGWWNQLPSAEEPRAHYTRLYTALRNLKGAYKPPADDPVRQVRDLWKSLPQLNDKGGLDQMIDACDALVQ